MNRLERLVRIHRLLSSKRPVPMRRFMGELGISRTTVTRDFEYLREFLNAPIIYDRDANGHHYDPQAQEFQLPGFWLNQSELYALLAAEHLLETVQPGLLAPYLGPLKARIRSLLGQSGQRIDDLNQRIKVFSPGRREVDNDCFSAVAEATLAGQQLCFDYHGRSRDVRGPRKVHPHRLVNYRANWYLVATCEAAGAIRVFSLDRIGKPALLADLVRPADEAQVDRALEGSYGIFTGTAQAWAVLRFSPQAARWAAEERWHPDQLGAWKADGYELQVPYSNPTELIMEILRYGPEVEVLAPTELRDAVVERLREAVGKYC
jgi:predicted DNA-binding transcriptional regulator YafY